MDNLLIRYKDDKKLKGFYLPYVIKLTKLNIKIQMS